MIFCSTFSSCLYCRVGRSSSSRELLTSSQKTGSSLLKTEANKRERQPLTDTSEVGSEEEDDEKEGKTHLNSLNLSKENHQ